jgi:hypothetical protein
MGSRDDAAYAATLPPGTPAPVIPGLGPKAVADAAAKKVVKPLGQGTVSEDGPTDHKLTMPRKPRAPTEPEIEMTVEMEAESPPSAPPNAFAEDDEGPTNVVETVETVEPVVHTASGRIKRVSEGWGDDQS